MDIIGLHRSCKACDELVLLVSGEASKKWVVIKFNGLEEVEPVSPVVILLCMGAVGDCIAGSKLHRQVIILETMEGGRGQILKPSGICAGIWECSSISKSESGKW
jgi:hypothetical protein